MSLKWNQVLNAINYFYVCIPIFSSLIIAAGSTVLPRAAAGPVGKGTEVDEPPPVEN